MKYFIIKNKATGLWDICTDNTHNPPLAKYVWAGDFKTQDEAERYLAETLKNLKHGAAFGAGPIPNTAGTGNVTYTPTSNNQSGIVGIINAILRYGFSLLIIIGILYVINLVFPSAKITTTPQLNNTWVSEFFQNVSNARGQPYAQCNQLDYYAQQRYYDLNLMNVSYSNNLNNNETMLAPIELETENGAPSGYTTASPKSYLQNYTGYYYQLVNTSYSYYGYYIFNATGNFGN